MPTALDTQPTQQLDASHDTFDFDAPTKASAEVTAGLDELVQEAANPRINVAVAHEVGDVALDTLVEEPTPDTIIDMSDLPEVPVGPGLTDVPVFEFDAPVRQQPEFAGLSPEEYRFAQEIGHIVVPQDVNFDRA